MAGSPRTGAVAQGLSVANRQQKWTTLYEEMDKEELQQPLEENLRLVHPEWRSGGSNCSWEGGGDQAKG